MPRRKKVSNSRSRANRCSSSESNNLCPSQSETSFYACSLRAHTTSAAGTSASFKKSLRSLPTENQRPVRALDQISANCEKRLGRMGPMQRRFRNQVPACSFSIIPILSPECESPRIHNPSRPIAPGKHRQEDLLPPECLGCSRSSQRRIFANYPLHTLYTASCPQAGSL